MATESLDPKKWVFLTKIGIEKWSQIFDILKKETLKYLASDFDSGFPF